MNLRRILFILMILFLFPQFASAQVEIVNVNLAPMVIFHYSDWESQPNLLTVTLENTSDTEQIFTLQTIIIDQSTGMEVYNGESYKHVFAPNQTRTLNNVDLLGYAKSIQFDDDTQSEIQELGYISAGTYCFQFKSDGTLMSDPAGQTEWCFTVTNPPNPTLISPGSADYTDPIEVPTNMPLFQWTAISDNPDVYYELTLCEVEEGQTPTEAIENEPVYFANSEENRDLFLPPPPGQPSSLQYSGIEALEQGIVYCWQIVAYVPSSSGYDTYDSEIWSFTVSTTEELTPEQAFLIDFLRQRGVSENTLVIIKEGTIETVYVDGESVPNSEIISELSGDITFISFSMSQ